MFSSEIYGYKRSEVDSYISSLKSDYEKAILDEKLKVLDAEKRMLELKNKASEIEKREKKILSVLDMYKKGQAEGTKNIDTLRLEQLKMVYLHLQAFMDEINAKYPGVLVNNNYKKLITEIETILSTQNKSDDIAAIDNDPMRALLSKMQEKKVQETKQVKEVKIERTDRAEKAEHVERPSLIKPVTQMELSEDDKYDNLVDKFLNSKPPEEQPRAFKIQSSGFDLKEAINPKEDLSEIMKAFDFYSDKQGDDKIE